MNPKFISKFSESFHIYVNQCLQDILEEGMNKPETRLRLAKCLPDPKRKWMHVNKEIINYRRSAYIQGVRARVEYTFVRY